MAFQLFTRCVGGTASRRISASSVACVQSTPRSLRPPICLANALHPELHQISYLAERKFDAVRRGGVKLAGLRMARTDNLRPCELVC
jgi:hypothetical protein